jgi:hypothetical protein
VMDDLDDVSRASFSRACVVRKEVSCVCIHGISVGLLRDGRELMQRAALKAQNKKHSAETIDRIARLE